MKGIVQVIILIIFMFIGIPLVVGLAFSERSEGFIIDYSSQKIETPERIKVWNEEKGKVEKVDFEEYVINVVASEMPSNFEIEALKSQAVAARTYAMSKIIKFDEKEPESHPKAPVCNTTHCQVYKNKKTLIELHDKGWEKDGYEKVKKACEETEGEMIYYKGQIIMQPLFFSSSGGQTENSEDVFSDEYPYLISVSSPYEEGASHRNEKKTFEAEEVANMLNSSYEDRSTGKIDSSNVKVLSRTAGGRVDKIQVGESIYKGTEVRNALGLSSTLFSIGFDSEKIVFTSSGFGHGVGMSQYGANGMAKEGKDYKEILTHYYTGTDVY
ncbi:MAG: stage II sporulation protein D [Firmicutes bacterium]|nr:stage II sporulation protein D [Bacillota bacterium]